MSKRDLDRCPKCRRTTWRFNIYLHVVADGHFYGNVGKRAFRRKGIRAEAALWETVSWFCVNPKCMHRVDPPKRVRLENT